MLIEKFWTVEISFVSSVKKTVENKEIGLQKQLIIARNKGLTTHFSEERACKALKSMIKSSGPCSN